MPKTTLLIHIRASTYKNIGTPTKPRLKYIGITLFKLIIATNDLKSPKSIITTENTFNSLLKAKSDNNIRYDYMGYNSFPQATNISNKEYREIRKKEIEKNIW